MLWLLIWRLGCGRSKSTDGHMLRGQRVHGCHFSDSKGQRRTPAENHKLPCQTALYPAEVRQGTGDAKAAQGPFQGKRYARFPESAASHQAVQQQSMSVAEWVWATGLRLSGNQVSDSLARIRAGAPSRSGRPRGRRRSQAESRRRALCGAQRGRFTCGAGADCRHHARRKYA